MPMKFRRADIKDIPELMRWFDSAASCKLWGGPNFEYPFTLDTFYRDLRWFSIDSFSLAAPGGELLGFGQVYEKLDRRHLARIVTHPGYRGKGYGRMLLRRLIGEAPDREYSLYVYEHNTTALSCYRSMRFQRSSRPAEDIGFDDCLFMVLKPGEPQKRIS